MNLTLGASSLRYLRGSNTRKGSLKVLLKRRLESLDPIVGLILPMLHLSDMLAVATVLTHTGNSLGELLQDLIEPAHRVIVLLKLLNVLVVEDTVLIFEVLEGLLEILLDTINAEISNAVANLGNSRGRLRLDPRKLLVDPVVEASLLDELGCDGLYLGLNDRLHTCEFGLDRRLHLA